MQKNQSFTIQEDHTPLCRRLFSPGQSRASLAPPWTQPLPPVLWGIQDHSENVQNLKFIRLISRKIEKPKDWKGKRLEIAEAVLEKDSIFNLWNFITFESLAPIQGPRIAPVQTWSWILSLPGMPWIGLECNLDNLTAPPPECSVMITMVTSR